MHQTPQPSSSSLAFYRYLPVSPEATQWGAYVTTAGYAAVEPHAPYPPHTHPTGHHFTWAKGRILTSFQFIYIAHGRGEFESVPGGHQLVEAGDLIVLFPDVWHRYRPDPETGWDEHWLELDGDYIRTLMRRPEFTPERPVLQLGHVPELLQAYETACELLRREPAGYQFQLGAQAVQVLALTLSAIKQKNWSGKPAAELIREARNALARPGNQHLRLEEMARKHNMSCTNFRRLFKAQTGFAPHQFAMQITVGRARDLLYNTTLPVSHIAQTLGFNSIFYFSRFFKKQTGLAPADYRRRKTGYPIPTEGTATSIL